MALRLYNTLTRKIQPFKELTRGTVRMYVCGPTVYSSPHIGNYRAYVFADLLKRYLLWKGYTVKHVMNITDVDDKTIRDSQKEGKSLNAFTEFYTKGFFEDLTQLNILLPETIPKATDHIEDMVQLVQDLLKKGIAYKGEDGSVYFAISKFPDYGNLARLNTASLKAGASGRVAADEYDKTDVRDFALWKAWTADDGNVFWDTLIGKGRPGWHIECSAMSMKYLGTPFDIHVGGVDLIFPHHQNELAQSEAATGKKFVNWWLHNEWLLMEGKKMSKSLGNIKTLRVLEQHAEPLGIRFLLLSAHYRTKLNFTKKGLAAAGESLASLRNLVRELRAVHADDPKAITQETTQTRELFEAALDNDLNVPEAFAVLFHFVRDTRKQLAEQTIADAPARLAMLFELDTILGLRLSEHGHEWKTVLQAPAMIRELIEQREQCRLTKEWTRADEIRVLLREQGVLIEDTDKGPRWHRL